MVEEEEESSVYMSGSVGLFGGGDGCSGSEQASLLHCVEVEVRCNYHAIITSRVLLYVGSCGRAARYFLLLYLHSDNGRCGHPTRRRQVRSR
jgi:hypothetical protein